MALNIAQSPLIGPVVALNGWTLFMEVWMYVKRIPAINKAVEAGKLSTGPEMTKEKMNAALPASVRWPADNYNHLLEQPQQFYVITLALAMLGHDDDVTVKLAWAYVSLRIVHSLVQSLANPIMVRFSIFILSSATLAGLVGRAAQMVFLK